MVLTAVMSSAGHIHGWKDQQGSLSFKMSNFSLIPKILWLPGPEKTKEYTCGNQMQIPGHKCIIDVYRHSRTKDHERDFRAFKKKWSLEPSKEQDMSNSFDKERLFFFHLIILKSYSFLGYKSSISSLFFKKH